MHACMRCVNQPFNASWPMYIQVSVYPDKFSCLTIMSVIFASYLTSPKLEFETRTSKTERERLSETRPWHVMRDTHLRVAPEFVPPLPLSLPCSNATKISFSLRYVLSTPFSNFTDSTCNTGYTLGTQLAEGGFSKSCAQSSSLHR